MEKRRRTRADKRPRMRWLQHKTWARVIEVYLLVTICLFLCAHWFGRVVDLVTQQYLKIPTAPPIWLWSLLKVLAFCAQATVGNIPNSFFCGCLRRGALLLRMHLSLLCVWCTRDALGWHITEGHLLFYLSRGGTARHPCRLISLLKRRGNWRFIAVEAGGIAHWSANTFHTRLSRPRRNYWQ